MSYILDALRRAEAERERGLVPGLHSQPNASAATVQRRGPLTLAAFAAAGVVLVVAAAGLWL
ncbi:MAG: hypothetical protein KGI35_17810, partial [Burkholderiales bacterium]|nr:hypothetical protein [Burkholderiales bacterium]